MGGGGGECYRRDSVAEVLTPERKVERNRSGAGHLSLPECPFSKLVVLPSSASTPTRWIDVEVDLYRSGMARDFILVGMPDTAVQREAGSESSPR